MTRPEKNVWGSTKERNRRDWWGWRLCKQEGMRGGKARPRLRYWGQTVLVEQEVSTDRSASGRTQWGGGGGKMMRPGLRRMEGFGGRSKRPPREGRACANGWEALQDWREVCFAIALNAVNILVLCLSVNIQFSLIHVFLWVTGSLAEFYISYY